MKTSVHTRKYFAASVGARRWKVLLLSFLLSFSAMANQPQWLKTIEKKPFKLFVNTTNDIYLLQKGMMERYNPDGTFFQNYGSIYIDERTQIISVNSFKTILFAPDFGKIIQLDNRLREIDVIDAYNLGTYIITCVGSSYDNNFLWLWDAGTQRLIKLDKDNQPAFVSNTLSLWIGKSLQPVQMIESGILLYVLDRENGIYIFDNQGNYMKNIPVKHIYAIKIIDDRLYYTKEDGLYSYDPISFSEIKYTATPPLKKIQIGKTVLAGVNADGWVEIWKF